MQVPSPKPRTPSKRLREVIKNRLPPRGKNTGLFLTTEIPYILRRGAVCDSKTRANHQRTRTLHVGSFIPHDQASPALFTPCRYIHPEVPSRQNRRPSLYLAGRTRITGSTPFPPQRPPNQRGIAAVASQEEHVSARPDLRSRRGPHRGG